MATAGTYRDLEFRQYANLVYGQRQSGIVRQHGRPDVPDIRFETISFEVTTALI